MPNQAKQICKGWSKLYSLKAGNSFSRFLIDKTEHIRFCLWVSLLILTGFDANLSHASDCHSCTGFYIMRTDPDICQQDCRLFFFTKLNPTVLNWI